MLDMSSVIADASLHCLALVQCKGSDVDLVAWKQPLGQGCTDQTSECVMAHRIQIVDCHERFGGEARPNAGGPGFGWHAECFGGHLLVVGWFWGLSHSQLGLSAKSHIPFTIHKFLVALTLSGFSGFSKPLDE